MAPLTMLNTVVVSPIPRENARMAMRESTGELISMRTPYLTSLKNPSMALSPPTRSPPRPTDHANVAPAADFAMTQALYGV